MTSPITIKDRQADDAQILQRQEDIAAARKQIKNAFQATMFIGGITTMIWLAALSGKDLPGYSAWNILDVICVFGLGYGISRNNETCAKVMFGYFLLGKIIPIFSGQFVPASNPLSGFMLYCLWEGIIGTQSYNHLMQEEEKLAQVLTVAPEPTRTRPPEPRRSVSEPSQPLNPTPELLSLCGGDRAQAQWLLSQVKIKNPDRSLDWYNRQAIYKLTNKTAPESEQSQLDED